MKKKIFVGIAVLAIAVVIVFNVNMSTQKNSISLLSLANIEALANESGTSAKWCFIRQSYGVNNKHTLFCDDRTKDDEIFSCPAESFGVAVEASKDRCTTKD